MKMMIESGDSIEESNKTPLFYGPSEHALSLKLIELISKGLLPLLVKVQQNPEASSESVPVSSSRKVKNPLRNPVESTAAWKALKDSQNPLRYPVKDIQEFQALKQEFNPFRCRKLGPDV